MRIKKFFLTVYLFLIFCNGCNKSKSSNNIEGNNLNPAFNSNSNTGNGQSSAPANEPSTSNGQSSAPANDPGNNKPAPYQPANLAPNIYLYAGNIGSTGYFDGIGIATRFNHPTGITIDTANNIYILDNSLTQNINKDGKANLNLNTTNQGLIATLSPTVRKIDKNGNITTISINLPEINSTLPEELTNNITITSSNFLYIANSARYNDNHSLGQIFQIPLNPSESKDGQYPSYRLVVNGSDNGTPININKMGPIFSDNNDNLYFADIQDTDHANIFKILSSDLNYVYNKYFKTGIRPNNGIDPVAVTANLITKIDYSTITPKQISIDNFGNIFITDSQRLFKIDTNKNLSEILLNNIDISPTGITIDKQGFIYLTDSKKQTVNKIKIDAKNRASIVQTINLMTNTTSSSSTVVNSSASIKYSTNYNGIIPMFITVDSNNNLYITDHDNSTINKIDAAGNMATIGGVPYITGNTDGLGNFATFNNPSGLTMDNKSNLYIADTFNNEIRKIDANGSVSTVVSIPTSGDLSACTMPTSIACDNNGNIYFIGLSTVQAICQIDSAGNLKKIVDSTKIALYAPRGITHCNNKLYFTDISYMNNLTGVSMFDLTNDKFSPLPGPSSGFKSTSGIVSDSSCNIYAADAFAKTISKYDGNSWQQLNISSNNLMGQISTLAIDSNNNLYTLDVQSSTINMIDTSNNIKTIVGNTNNSELLKPTFVFSLFIIQNLGFTLKDGTQVNYSPGLAVDNKTGNIFVTILNGVLKISR